MKIDKKLILGLIPVILIVISIGFMLKNTFKKSPVVFTGLIETKQVNAASLLPGRVESILVEEGDMVTKGQIVAILEDKIISAKINQAQGLMESAKSIEKLASKGNRTENKESAEHQYIIAKKEYEFSKKTYEHYLSLFKDSIISQQEMDVIKLKYESSKEQLDISKNLYKIALKGARDEELNTAKGQVKSASGVYDEAQAFKDELIIRSPVDGEIAEQIAETGEVVGAGYPILTIFMPDKNYALLQVREDKMVNFKKGSKHTIQVPALNNSKFEVYVHYISPMADFATWEPTQLKGDYNLKTFEVHLKPIEKIDNLRPGMSFELILNEDSN
jgi:HlyD family secretion protein